jgi:chromosome condensin MukBEF complex kleisin-like MukF subunit
LARLCLGCVVREKPQSLPKYRELNFSVIGQSQAVFISVAEDDYYYYNS